MYCKVPECIVHLEISWHFPAAPYRPSALTKLGICGQGKYDASINIVISGFADLEREFRSGMFGSE